MFSSMFHCQNSFSGLHTRGWMNDLVGLRHPLLLSRLDDDRLWPGLGLPLRTKLAIFEMSLYFRSSFDPRFGATLNRFP